MLFRSQSTSDPGSLGKADEQEARVLVDADLAEPVFGALELLVLVHVGRRQEAPVEVVRPGVVRALHGLAQAAAAGLGVEDPRSPMGADVVEGPEGAVAVPDDEDRLAGDVADEVVAASSAPRPIDRCRTSRGRRGARAPPRRRPRSCSRRRSASVAGASRGRRRPGHAGAPRWPRRFGGLELPSACAGSRGRPSRCRGPASAT